MPESRTLKISVMDTSVFLYMPVFYAAGRDFFGFIEGPINCIPQSAFPRTDVATVRALTEKGPNGEYIADFVVCDPIALLDAPQFPQLCLLAAVVANGAFWAVNHSTHKVQTLADLAQFTEIIAFQKGSTSHRIASQAFEYAGQAPRIRETHPGDELVLLT